MLKRFSLPPDMVNYPHISCMSYSGTRSVPYGLQGLTGPTGIDSAAVRSRLEFVLPGPCDLVGQISQ